MSRRKEVVQFDSPEKQHMRAKQFEYGQSVQGQIEGSRLSPEYERRPKPRDPYQLDTVERLYMAEQRKESKVGRLRFEKELKEKEELKDKPEINSHYRYSRSRTPVHMRPLADQKEKFESAAKLRRKLEGERAEREARECTFAPQVRVEATPRSQLQIVEDLLRWKRERDLHLMHTVSSGVYEKDLTFRPRINSKSVQLVACSDTRPAATERKTTWQTGC